MERFSIVPSSMTPGSGTAFRPDPNGEWVKFADVERLISLLRTARKHLPPHARDCDQSRPGKHKCEVEAIHEEISRLLQS